MRSYKEILSFLIIREQLSLGWKIAFFVVCGALLYGSLTVRQMSLRSVDVGGTVVASSNDVTGETAPAFLTVRLESGETVQASVNGKIDYRPGRRVILRETTANFFAVRKHEFKKYLDEPVREPSGGAN
jgi:hypothetical protein